MRNILLITLLTIITFLFSSCGNDENGEDFITPDEDAMSFTKISSITIGDEGAAEISAFDPLTDQLFVLNNAGISKIDVINLSDPAAMSVTTSIDMTQYGAGVNSVAVNGSYLAAAVQADVKTDNGSIVVFNIEDLTVAAVVTAGPLPDMITFSPNGLYIVAANEGEPNDQYTLDPDGSITIITVNDFSAVTLDFSAFNGQQSMLADQGFRVTGPGADLAADVEPEYIAISADSKTAFVALQENNGLARIDLTNKTITDLVGLGLKKYGQDGFQFDPSDKDDGVAFKEVPENIVGVYMPDAISTFTVNGINYIISANEGDSREYFYDASESICLQNGGDFDEDDGCLAFTDEERLEKVNLDPVAFPNAEELQKESNFGRLKMMTTNGDTDGDGDYDQIYTYGARSFSIWDTAGKIVFDSGDEIEKEIVKAGLYEDGRSDDKGVEPEGVVVGQVNGKAIAFIGLERVDAVIVYDISNPAAPQFLTILKTGDAPEGLVFIAAEDSPTDKSLLIVTCEGDGSVWTYSPSLNQ